MDRIKRVNALLRRIQQSDSKALDELYLEYGSLLLGMARKYLIDKEYAEYLLSDVLYELYEKRANSFNTGFNGLNWLYKTIKHKAFAMNKQQGKTVVLDEDSFTPSELIADERREDYIDLQRAFETLDDIERKIIRMKFWEGLTIREIAVELNRKHTAVFYVYKKTIKKIKDFLNK